MNIRTDYDYELCGNTLVIYSPKQGSRSLIRDIEQILQVLKKRVPCLAFKKIIYRDSERVFEGIHIDQAGHFIDFYPLGERVLDLALNKVNRHALTG